MAAGKTAGCRGKGADAETGERSLTAIGKNLCWGRFRFPGFIQFYTAFSAKAGLSPAWHEGYFYPL